MGLQKRELKLSKWGLAWPDNAPGKKFVIHDDLPDTRVDITDLSEIQVIDAYPATEPERPVPKDCQMIQREGLVIIYYPP